MATINKNGIYMSSPKGISRGNPIPLDSTEIWYSKSEMEAYAKGQGELGKVSYVGQILQLVDETARTATAFIIANEAGDLIEVGSSTLGDYKSIELNNGVLRIIGVDTAEENSQLVMGSNGKVKWVKPDTSTVTGLQTAVATNTDNIAKHESRLNTAESDIDKLEETFAGMGAIFNFAGSLSTEDFGNAEIEDYNPGDVVLVDSDKEYVCVEVGGTKRWELLGDPSGVNILQGKVETLEGKVEALETFKAGASTSLGVISGDITNLKNADNAINESLATKASLEYVNSNFEQIAEKTNKISVIEGQITGINTQLTSKAEVSYVDNKVSDINNQLASKADTSALNALDQAKASKEQLNAGLANKVGVVEYEAQVAAFNTAIGNISDTATAADTLSKANETAIQTLQGEIGGKASASEVNALKEQANTNSSNIGILQTSISTLTGNISGLNDNKADKSELQKTNQAVAANTKAIEDHAVEYATLKGRVDKAEEDIVKAQGDATSALNSATAANTAAGAAQSAADNAMAKAVEVLGTAEDDASANTVYGAKAAAADAQESVDELSDVVDELLGTVDDLKTAYETADSLLSDRIADIEAVIDGVQGAMHFVGISTTDPSAGSVVINGKDDYNPVDGDVVIYNDDGNSIEYIYSVDKWVELGDVSAEAKRIQALETYKDETVAPALAKIPTIEDNITAHSTAINSLLDRIDAAEEVNTTQNEAIKALQERAGTIEKSIEDTAAAIREELANVDANLDGKITAEATARDLADQAINERLDAIDARLTWTKF